LSPIVQTSHASSFAPEKNSTLSSSSASNFAGDPITTIIIPNESLRLSENSSSNDNVTSAIDKNVSQSNSSLPGDKNPLLVENKIDMNSPNNTFKSNVSSEVTNKSTISDSQQRGEYLTDNNGIHYYNLKNCSEKKGSSGIGDMSECEDAAKQMSEE
jgi:hypothetical protein